MVMNYFGELGGMVGSMETMAPSGSTIMMALFLEEDKEQNQMGNRKRGRKTNNMQNIIQIIILTVSGELNLYNNSSGSTLVVVAFSKII